MFKNVFIKNFYQTISSLGVVLVLEIPIMVKDLIEPNDFCIKNCKKIFNDLFEVIEYLKK